MTLLRRVRSLLLEPLQASSDAKDNLAEKFTGCLCTMVLIGIYLDSGMPHLPTTVMVGLASLVIGLVFRGFLAISLPDPDRDLQEVVARYQARIDSVHQVDRRTAARAAADAYRLAGYRDPPSVWVRSPREARLALHATTIASTSGLAAVATAAPDGVDSGEWSGLVARLRDGLWTEPRTLHPLATALAGMPSAWENARPALRSRAEKLQAHFQWRIQVPADVHATAVADTLAFEGFSALVGITDPAGHDPGLAGLAAHEHLAATSSYRMPPMAKAMITLSSTSGGWWPTPFGAVLGERPTHLKKNKDAQLHATDGPALAYADGWKVWAIEGTAVRQRVIEEPQHLTIEDIQPMPFPFRTTVVERFGRARYIAALGETARRIADEPVPWLARPALAQFGEERYIKEVGEMIDSDLDAQGQPRRLWRAERLSEAAVVMLEVVNSTPEPDGSRHHYFLRVPPTTVACRAAVAWTFGMRADQYAPEFES